ncbi:MAG: SDR family NAD(P)-dependent oxidoreductase [Candidatus Lokiarchaeota archaeon]|nr:SDR family NAD(P)-dependent oxidoreductase [Candidatus Lokiarchaeota archaeon]
MLLKGKNIVVTGSGRGIGKSVAIACAKEGANIGLISRTLEELEDTKQKILDLNTGVKVVLKTADVTKFEDIENAIKSFASELGSLNGVIANAGYSRMWATHEFDNEKFSQILDVNILGVFHTFKASYPYMKKDDKNDKARFVITGSEAYPNAPSRLIAYVASKYAVVGMQKALAAEYKRENINFNMVLPTQVDTRLLRGKNAGDGNKAAHVLNPWDLNEFYVFLLSDYANRVDNALIFTQDLNEVKKLLAEAPAGKKENWEVFKDYLEEIAPQIFENVKNLGKLVDFIIERMNK